MSDEAELAEADIDDFRALAEALSAELIELKVCLSKPGPPVCLSKIALLFIKLAVSYDVLPL